MQKISKWRNYIPVISKTKIKKWPLKRPQGKTSSLNFFDGDPKKNEKSLETLLKSKLSKLILYLKIGTNQKRQLIFWFY
jgi:hypothetical protein